MVNIPAILRAWFERRAARKRERDLIAAERRRNAIVKAMNERRAAHREYKPLLSDLRKATNASLQASTNDNGLDAIKARRERIRQVFQASGGLL